MWKDPIVDEVRKNREKLAKKKHYSLKKIFDDVQKKPTVNPQTHTVTRIK